MKSKIIFALVLIVVASSFGSCSIFRKKNKCNSCPTWDDEIQTEISINAQKVDK